MVCGWAAVCWSGLCLGDGVDTFLSPEQVWAFPSVRGEEEGEEWPPW